MPGSLTMPRSPRSMLRRSDLDLEPAALWPRRGLGSPAFSSAFFAQAVGQEEAPLEDGETILRAQGAYRRAADLRIELLGNHYPVDLRV